MRGNQEAPAGALVHVDRGCPWLAGLPAADPLAASSGQGWSRGRRGAIAPRDDPIGDRHRVTSANDGGFSIPLEVVSQFLAGAFLHLLKWWLMADMPYPPEHMEEYFQRLALFGTRAACASSASLWPLLTNVSSIR